MRVPGSVATQGGQQGALSVIPPEDSCSGAARSMPAVLAASLTQRLSRSHARVGILTHCWQLYVSVLDDKWRENHRPTEVPCSPVNDRVNAVL